MVGAVYAIAEEKCALTDVVYSTGDFMRQCKNVCKTRSLINICMSHHVILVVRSSGLRPMHAVLNQHDDVFYVIQWVPLKNIIIPTFL